MKKVCVFAGSSSGSNQNYKKLSRKLGSIIANNNGHLFYGGGNSGLMGEVADGCLENNGKVTGVIPGFLCDMQADHKGLTNIIITAKTWTFAFGNFIIYAPRIPAMAPLAPTIGIADVGSMKNCPKAAPTPQKR